MHSLRHALEGRVSRPCRDVRTRSQTHDGPTGQGRGQYLLRTGAAMGTCMIGGAAVFGAITTVAKVWEASDNLHKLGKQMDTGFKLTSQELAEWRTEIAETRVQAAEVHATIKAQLPLLTTIVNSLQE